MTRENHAAIKNVLKEPQITQHETAGFHGVRSGEGRCRAIYEFCIEVTERNPTNGGADGSKDFPSLRPLFYSPPARLTYVNQPKALSHGEVCDYQLPLNWPRNSPTLTELQVRNSVHNSQALDSSLSQKIPVHIVATSWIRLVIDPNVLRVPTSGILPSGFPAKPLRGNFHYAASYSFLSHPDLQVQVLTLKLGLRHAVHVSQPQKKQRTESYISINCNL